MIYEQCNAASRNGKRCVMFDGHRPIDTRTQHNYGGLGPYTPGQNPASYVPRWMYMPLRRRLLARLSPWESQSDHDLRVARKAMKSARKISRELSKRPFSDQDTNDPHGR